MAYWDTEYKFDYSCPLCHQSPGRLRDRADIITSKQDWGEELQRVNQEDALERANDYLNDGMPFRELPLEARVAWERDRESQTFQRMMERMQQGGRGIV